MVDKSKVTAAFRALRKEGFIAKQNFLCCQNCACCALDTPENQGKPAVFFTKQDGEVFDERSSRRFLHLTFGIVNGGDDNDVLAVGEKTVRILQNAGLTVEWNGLVDTRLMVS